MPVVTVVNDATPCDNTSSKRIRKNNQPTALQRRRSYMPPNPIERRTSAPVKLHTIPSVMEKEGSGREFPDQKSATLPHLPQRSHSSVQSSVYAPPLPKRTYSGWTTPATTTLSRILPTLGEFEEDEEDERYAIVEALSCIIPKQHGQSDHEVTASCKNVEGLPNIGKLQKKLWKRNSTLKKGKHPSVQKRSLTHSSDASSDDSDTGRNKSRRVSSYHPPRRMSLTKSKMVRRKTTTSYPSVASLVENTIPESIDVDQSSVLSDRNIPISPTSDGDNEASEYFASNKCSVVRKHLRC